MKIINNSKEILFNEIVKEKFSQLNKLILFIYIILNHKNVLYYLISFFKNNKIIFFIENIY